MVRFTRDIPFISGTRITLTSDYIEKFHKIIIAASFLIVAAK
jgi:hypothetical protein